MNKKKSLGPTCSGREAESIQAAMVAEGATSAAGAGQAGGSSQRRWLVAAASSGAVWDNVSHAAAGGGGGAEGRTVRTERTAKRLPTALQPLYPRTPLSAWQRQTVVTSDTKWWRLAGCAEAIRSQRAKSTPRSALGWVEAHQNQLGGGSPLARFWTLQMVEHNICQVVP